MSDSPAVVIFNSSGTELCTSAAPLRVDPTGTTTQPVSGSSESSTGSAVPAKANLAGGTDGTNLRALLVDSVGKQIITQKSSTATLSNVASSASSVTLLSANSSRYGATIVNDSTQVLYVKFGAAASATSYTVRMSSNSYYEVPFGYTGIIDGVWVSADGYARVTEIT